MPRLPLPTGRGQRRCAVAAAGAAVAAGGLTAWWLRHGLSPTLDASSYLSATREVSRGHPFTTRLAPSFSNFDVVEFLGRGGRLPFVDFPIGYPLLAGLLAAVVGAEAALVAVTVAAVVAVAVLAVAGADGAHRPAATLALRAVAGVGIVSLSTYRIVTRSVLSEPLFCALALGLLAALLRYRRSGRSWGWSVALATACGLVRFVGAPLAVLLALERRRRGAGRAASIGWAAAAVAPAAANLLWTGAAGGGHSAGWRGVEEADVRLFVRSVGGWVDARQGNIGLTYFGSAGPAWWSWPLTAVWLVVGLVSVAGVARLLRTRLPEPLELALAASVVLTAGVVAGMAGFDSLVAPENRVMLPAGVIVLAGAAWSIPALHRPSADRTGGAAPTVTRRTWLPWVAWPAVGLWIAVAVVPRGINVFADRVTEPAAAAAARESAASIVVSTDADPIHWWTGLPAAYLPLATVALTGEEVDVAALWAQLPCALADADGVVVIVDGPSFFGDPRAELRSLVDQGLLTVTPEEGASVYRPVPDACTAT